MHIPLIIAILAFLAWMLLPQLDHFQHVEPTGGDMRSYLSRLARWVNG